MLPVDRQNEIIRALFRSGSVKTADLGKKYDVREETIRRDLKAVAGRLPGINIVYGGAYLEKSSEAVKESKITAKRALNYEQKQTIARKAAALVRDGDVIGLNSGSTVEYIIDYIGDKNIKIVTLNVNAAAKALLAPNVEVYIPGGLVRGASGMVIGPNSVEFIKSFAIDKCFFGVSAICMQRGVMHPVMEEIELNAAMLTVSSVNYVVTDSSKLQTTSLFTMAKFESIDNIIVDDDFPKEYLDFMALRNINVI
jgi:DeoR/GlpR family transcriptional regulator of sugar metabolism